MRAFLIAFCLLLFSQQSATAAAFHNSKPTRVEWHAFQKFGSLQAVHSVDARHWLSKAKPIQKLVARLLPKPDEADEAQPYDTLSILSLIFGILSVLGLFLGIFWFGFALLLLLSPVAVVFGILGITRKRRTGKRGLGMAIAGLVLGSIGCLLGLTVLAIALAF